MRSTHRRTATAALVAVTALTLGACGFFPRASATDTYTLTDEITAVRIELDAGSVALRGTDATAEIRVERTVDYAGDYPEDDTHSVEDGVLVLAGCGRHCAASYTVDLPAGLPVTGETQHGSIDLTATGAVDVSSSNGSIMLTDVAAPVVARTSNGRISGTGLRGDGVDVETSNGSIEIEVAVPQDVRAVTDNGSVRLTVPDGSYRVRAETDNGGTDVSVPNTPDGEFELDAESSNGRVTVLPAT
jgi:hypothetical protein